MRKIFGVILLVAIVANMGFIYYQSAQSAAVSGEISGQVTDKVAEVVVPDIEEKPVTEQQSIKTKLHIIVRNLAHAAEFALLGFLCFLFCDNLMRTRNFFHFLVSFGAAFVFCGLYALSDEYHQKFVPGRAFELKDLGVDLLGAVSGVLCAVILLSAIRGIARLYIGKKKAI